MNIKELKKLTKEELVKILLKLTEKHCSNLSKNDIVTEITILQDEQEMNESNEEEDYSYYMGL